MNYDILLDEATQNGLKVEEKPLKYNNGRIKGNNILIRTGLTIAEKIGVLAEEIGHFYTSTGNILDQTKVINLKQEYIARGWAYKRVIPPGVITDGFKQGHTELWSLAEYLGVTPEFLEEAIIYYKVKGLL